MTIMLGLLAAAAAGQPAPANDAFGRCLKRSGSMLEEARCYVVERERLQAEQAALLERLAARLKRPGPPGTDYPAAAAALAKAQSAWIAYKNADCEIVDDVFGAGNAIGLAGETCVIDHYTTRNTVLGDLLKGYLSDE